MNQKLPDEIPGSQTNQGSRMDALVTRAATFWAASVPRAPFLVVWGLALAGFLLFAGRFAFLGLNFHGLPRHEFFFVYWLVAALGLAAGAWFGGRSALAFLVALPVLMVLEGSAVFPFGQLPIHLFNFLALGWLLRFVFLRTREIPSPRWPDFLVGSFGATATLASLYALASPSWRNSISVAFSAFSWNGEMNEFDALWMGHFVLAGCLLFLMVRTAVERDGVVPLHRAVLMQFILLICVWAGIVVFLVWQERHTGQAPLFLPLLSKQDIAGMSLLILGYSAGLATHPSTSLRGRLGFTLLGLGALFMMFVSASKASLVVAPVVLAMALMRLRKARIPVALALCGMAALLIVLLQFQGQRFSPYASSQVASLLTNPVQLITDSSSSLRVATWRNSLALLGHYPLGGTGLGSSTSLLPHFPVNGFQGSLDWNIYANPGTANEHFSTHNSFNCHSDFLEVAVSMGPVAALLLLSIYGFLLLLTWKNPHANSGHPADKVASGLLLALTGYFLFSLFDSRIASFAGGLVFWQFVALGVGVTIPSGAAPNKSKFWWTPALAPAFCAIGAAWVLATSALPNDRVFGIWNWHLRDEDGRFLLAREAGFVVPPFEDLEALSFRLPDSSESESALLLVQWDDGTPQTLEINKTSDTRFPLDRKPDAWHRVRVVSEGWCGRGILGLPLGVESYAVAMRKEKDSPAEDTSSP